MNLRGSLQLAALGSHEKLLNHVRLIVFTLASFLQYFYDFLRFNFLVQNKLNHFSEAAPHSKYPCSWIRTHL